MAAKGVSSGATNTAKGLADALIPREIASVVPKAAPNAVKAAPKALTGAQQFAKDMAGKFNPPKPPLPGPSPDIAQLAAKGGYNMASGMLNPKGYGLSDLMYPAGAAYGRIRQGLKAKMDPSKGVAGLANLLKSKGNDGASSQAGTVFNPSNASATLASGLTPLQKALIAGGISIPAAIALSRSIGSKGSDELPEDEEA
jgi:hypothetical protein